MSDKFDMQKAQAARDNLEGYYRYKANGYHPECEPLCVSEAAMMLPAALDRIEELQATIESLKTAIISDRTELVLYSPDYIVWRYHNDIDKIESQDDWEPLEVEAKAQLAREYPEIFGDAK